MDAHQVTLTEYVLHAQARTSKNQVGATNQRRTRARHYVVRLVMGNAKRVLMDKLRTVVAVRHVTPPVQRVRQQMQSNARPASRDITSMQLTRHAGSVLRIALITASLASPTA